MRYTLAVIADVLLAGIVLLGSSVQWLTGMGFALVAVPALVLLLGPTEGVVLANCAAGAICCAGLAGGWRLVRPRGFPRSLFQAELARAVSGPVAYRASRAHARRVAAAAPPP